MISGICGIYLLALPTGRKRRYCLHGETQTLREEVRQGFSDVRADFADAIREVRADIQKLNYAAEIDDPRRRVKRLENRTGLKA